MCGVQCCSSVVVMLLLLVFYALSFPLFFLSFGTIGLMAIYLNKQASLFACLNYELFLCTCCC